MCGVLTLVQGKKSQFKGENIIKDMLIPLRESRGPDAGHSQKIWDGKEYSLFFGHARLSIIDVGERSNQPMVDNQTGFSLTFNGEIYNYKEIRSELGIQYNFKTESDTEVLLAALQVWGLEKTLDRLKGMFAFCAFHKEKQELWVARDRAGEKPLSYGKVGSDWVFTSDLRTLKAHPEWSPEVSLDVLKSYFKYRFVPHPYSLFNGFHKLPPGHFMKIQLQENINPKSQPYWSLWRELENREYKLRSNEDFLQYYKGITKRFVEASDVPMGCFLSGGNDSSLVAALLKEVSEQPIQAFTIRFDDPDYDESIQAQKVAQALGMKHRIVDFGINEFKSSFSDLINFLDEPSAVHSFYPLGYLSKVAKEQVKVCFSGDGGDELFGGYNRHIFWNRYMAGFSNIPSLGRTALSAGFNNRLAKFLFLKTGSLVKLRQAEDKYNKILKILSTKGVNSYYRELLSYEEILGSSSNDPLDPILELAQMNINDVEKMMALDFNFYLPNDVLNKVDRATMAYGLEARAPLLDIDSIRASIETPLGDKISKGQGKLVLKNMLNSLLPNIDHNLPKSGFTTPVNKWMIELMGKDFKDLFASSQLRSLCDQKTVDHLLSQESASEEQFVFYTLLNWLEKHDLKVSDV